MNKIRYRGPRRAGTFTRLAARLAAVAAVGTSISLVLPGPAWAGTSTVAGYQASTLFGLTSASATFTVPKITCTSADANTVELLGLFNLHGLTVEPLALGGPGLVAAIAAGCTGTTPGYNVNEYVNGAIDDGATVNAGDVIVVSMSQTATTEQVLVKDGSDQITGAKVVACHAQSR